MSTSTAPWPPESSVSLASIRKTLLDGASLIALGGGIAVLVAIAYLVFVPARFEASTEILFDPRGLKAVTNELVSRVENNESSISLLESQMRVVNSEPVLRAVVDRLNLKQDVEFTGAPGLLSPLLGAIGATPRKEPAETRALRQLQRVVHVERASRSYVVVVSAISEDPNKAARITDAVANAYIEEETRAQSDAAKRVSTAMTSRLRELADRLRSAEDNVENFKKTNNLIVSGTTRKLLSDQQLEELSTQLSQARNVTAGQRARIDQIDRAVRSGGDIEKLPEAVQSPLIAQLRSQYAEIVRQEGSATALLGERNPDVIVIRRRLSQHKQLITDELRRISAAARIDYARALENERTLSANLDRLKDGAVISGEAMVRLRELDRVVDASRAIYEAFLVRAKELGEQENVDTNNTRVIAPALPPDRPTTPRRSLVLVALAAGLICGAGLALLRRYRRGAPA